MRVILDGYGEQVAPLAYHTWWPGNQDGFYLFKSR